MSVAREERAAKRQLGQFLTPIAVARRILAGIVVDENDKVLEPSFGLGSFIDAYAEMLSAKGVDVSRWAQRHLFGCELDHATFEECRRNWKYGEFPSGLVERDFFRFEMPSYSRKEYESLQRPKYDLIIGNPPFGGTIDAKIQDELDSIFGFRAGQKIKKETYAFFIVKCLDQLKEGGRLIFICSDTLLSINTMRGLRRYLMDLCRVSVESMDGVFEDTKQPMIVLRLVKGGSGVEVYGEEKNVQQINATENLSWTINDELAKYFSGMTLGDRMVATSGMTVGCNEYFLRRIINGEVEEPYRFEFYRRRITLSGELEKARLGKISPRKQREILEMEKDGVTEKALRITRLSVPIRVKLPSDEYAPYNKGTSRLVYAPPTCAIYWKDEGEAVYTYKKSGPWYLHGVGGKTYFKRAGLTWQLISSHINIRYLPSGYILDSGAPCAFLRDGVAEDEMFFILGWCLTEKCNEILKKVINHTRNIQSKDFERLPYPVWIDDSTREKVVCIVKRLIERAQAGECIVRKDEAIISLEDLFRWKEFQCERRNPKSFSQGMLGL